MAGFNLGRIIGEKGEKGETGPKGDTGAKGEKGDKGDNGKDGLTPVFTVGEVTTLTNGESALVEIDSSNPENPVLSFKIPAGKDGRDALGDMLKTVYDTNGVGTDIFEYARKLFDDCLKTEGGNLSGSLTVAESPLSERAARNISIASSLPETGAEGDVFIVLNDKNAKTLGDCNEGDTVIIKENGKDTVYLVAGINYHGENTVSLLRKNLCPFRCSYDYERREQYSMSDIDIFLESMFISVFSPRVRNSLISVNNTDKAYRHCFLLSKNDYTYMNYFSDIKKRTACIEGTGYNDVHLTSSTGTKGYIVGVGTSGEFVSISISSSASFRPTIVLPSDFPVVNTQKDSLPAVMPVTPNPGIYVYAGGEWRECALL